MSLQKGEVWTQTHTCEEEGRDWSEAKQKPKMPKIASTSPEARREMWKRASSEGISPTNVFILDFWLPELWDSMFLLNKSLSSWYVVMATLTN